MFIRSSNRFILVKKSIADSLKYDKYHNLFYFGSYQRRITCINTSFF